MSLQSLTDQCVQCGLCLPTCPTYRLDAIEAESPRGRIALIKALEAGTLLPTPAGEQYLDHCLGCRRCEAVCPAGVAYGPILTSARASQRERRPPGWRQRGLERLAGHPHALSALLRIYRIVWPLLPSRLRLLPRPTVTAQRDFATAAPQARGESHHASLFLGCIARSYEAPLRAALQRLAAAANLEIEIPCGQTCCGSLHAHAGDDARSSDLGAINRTAFANGATVISLASGCHDALADSLRGQNDVRDAIEIIAERSNTLAFAPRRERVALHLPCTQRNVVRSDTALHQLLARIPELEIVGLNSGFGCCGAAGTQMLNNPERAAKFRQPLLDQLAASGATRLLSANIGCRLHMANGTALPVQHPLEFLAECLP
jgi:glycolate oxidase iron-sulfur subunit